MHILHDFFHDDTTNCDNDNVTIFISNAFFDFRVPSTSHRDGKHTAHPKKNAPAQDLTDTNRKNRRPKASKPWIHGTLKPRSSAHSPRKTFSNMSYSWIWVRDAPRIDGTRDVWKHLDSECRTAIFVQSVQELLILMPHASPASVSKARKLDI